MVCPIYAPREIFEQILKWTVIPTFDLVIEYGERGIITVKRKIAPYKNQWALPGLRMLKGEGIDDVLVRISEKEVGLKIDPNKRLFLGQYVGKFKMEHRRQDLSTGYLVKTITNQKVKLNQKHFHSYKFIKSSDEIPSETGAMYKFYLNQYLKMKKNVLL